MWAYFASLPCNDNNLTLIIFDPNNKDFVALHKKINKIMLLQFGPESSLRLIQILRRYKIFSLGSQLVVETFEHSTNKSTNQKSPKFSANEKENVIIKLWGLI